MRLTITRILLLTAVGGLMAFAPAAAQQPKGEPIPAPQPKGQPVPAQPKEKSIHTVRIWNGPVPTVKYVGFGMNHPEQHLLTKLEEAENTLARLEEEAIAARQTLDLKHDVEEARSRALIRYYNSPQIQYILSYGSGGRSYGGFGYGGYGGFGYGGYGGYGFEKGWGPQRYYYWLGAPQAIIVPPPAQGDPTATIDEVVGAQKLSEATTKSLAEARDRVAQLRSMYGVYNSDGELIGVNTDNANPPSQ